VLADAPETINVPEPSVMIAPLPEITPEKVVVPPEFKADNYAPPVVELFVMFPEKVCVPIVFNPPA